MKNPQERSFVFSLYKEVGMSIREIASRCGMSTTTVQKIIDQKGVMPDIPRKDKIHISKELLKMLHNECKGYAQRMHEKLKDENNTEVGYSTLTRLLRDYQISKPQKERCEQFPDEPGAEMHHDTTTYTIKVGGKSTKVVASIIYMRYSKVKFLKFYRNFTRFQMKCFIHEALMFFGYSNKICIIDNTNLARLIKSGTGKNAAIVPEMEQFSKQYGFAFVCHELRHSNRKAGVERSFWTTETNFLPGRTFESFDDLNQKAFEWATVKMFHQQIAKTDIIPAKAFEHEKSYMTKLADVLAPYISLQRIIDQYGYISVNGNFYWIPGTGRGEVKVFLYDKKLQVYLNRELLGEYEIPSVDLKNEKILPIGCLSKPGYQPHNRKKPTTREEGILRNLSIEVSEYLDLVLKSGETQKHMAIRKLYGLYRNIGDKVFRKSVERALKYRNTKQEILERIAVKMMKCKHDLPIVHIDQDFESRESYLEGKFSDEVDLSFYDEIMEEPDEE
ncbi:MAG: helix-turn-helix domain-containing protein [Candidatus Riflebacteria bacterium]|nr:helix-turn-helix domain-containing protein [Candidatus Riflebacteria bacterium]